MKKSNFAYFAKKLPIGFHNEYTISIQVITSSSGTFTQQIQRERESFVRMAGQDKHLYPQSGKYNMQRMHSNFEYLVKSLDNSFIVFYHKIYGFLVQKRTNLPIASCNLYSFQISGIFPIHSDLVN